MSNSQFGVEPVVTGKQWNSVVEYWRFERAAYLLAGI